MAKVLSQPQYLNAPEVVVEHQLEGRRRLCQQRPPGAVLNLRLQTTATECAFDAAIGEEQRFGALLLRTRPFDAGNNPQREGLSFGQCVRQEIEKPRHNTLFVKQT